jgi:hypothetical protein
MSDDKPRVIAELRKGSRIATWTIGGITVVIEGHPDYPPRLIYPDGRIVEITGPVAKGGGR